MLDGIRDAYHRRRFGAARADRIADAETAIRELPPKSITSAWTEWLWALPDEAWDEAIALRRDEASLVNLREAAVRTITRKNRLLASAEPVEAALADVATIRTSLLQLESAVREHSKTFSERFGEPFRDVL